MSFESGKKICLHPNITTKLITHKEPFVYAVKIAFKTKCRSQAFGKEKTTNYYS